MWLSEIDRSELMALTAMQKWDIICSGIGDDGERGEFALLLGTSHEHSVERALAAAKLYNSGRVGYVLPSGGVRWEHEGEMVSEAEFMSEILLREGVPEDAIILENEATTTRENMIYGTLWINRKTKFNDVDSIIIVTTLVHMKRSLALARAFMPRKVRISAYPSYPGEDKETWLSRAENMLMLDTELSIIKELVDNRIVEDMEISI